MRCLAEMNHDFRHFSRHLLAGTDVKRNAAPTPVTETQASWQCMFSVRESGATPFSSRYPFLIRGRGILPAHNMLIQIFFIQRCQRLIYFHHLITEVIRIEDSRRFHGSKSYKLNQMILYHIPQSSRRFVESATLLDSQILYSGNFYGSRYKSCSREASKIPLAKRKANTFCAVSLPRNGQYGKSDVLRKQKHKFYQFTCRFEVVTERFFNDDTRMGSIQSCSFQMQGNNTVK